MRFKASAIMPIVVTGFVLFTTTGCNSSTNQASGEHTSAASNPLPIDVQTSAGFTADYRAAEKVNQIPGLQGAVVLYYESQAFIGVYSIGEDTAVDPNKLKRDYGSNTAIYGGNQTDRKSAQEMRQQSLNNAAIYAEYPNQSTTTGHIPKERVAQIAEVLSKSSPKLLHIYVTAESHEVGRLQSYGRLIQSHRDMTPFTNEIRSTFREFWPTVKLS